MLSRTITNDDAKEIIFSFNMQIDKSYSYRNPQYTIDEINWFFWGAINRFIKSRLSGNNPIRKTIDESGILLDDLTTIIKSVTLTPVLYSGNLQSAGNQHLRYNVEYPDDFWYLLSNSCNIRNTKDNSIRDTSMYEKGYDNFQVELENSFANCNGTFETIRPLYVRTLVGVDVYMLKDVDYVLDGLSITYICDAFRLRPVNPQYAQIAWTDRLRCKYITAAFENMPEHTLYQIVQLAAFSALETVSDVPRMQTMPQNVQSQN